MRLLEVKDLRVTFPGRDGPVEAVKQVSFSVEAGESLGLVGESGSGKSVSVSSCLGLVPSPPAQITGSATFKGEDLLGATSSRWKSIRGKSISMVFQDPMTSLSPHMRVVDQVAEPLRLHEGYSKSRARLKAIEALDQVGIPDAAERAFAWPHEFSGGMRQRVMIAMAMITRPELLIADEPTTALDVTVQRQILDVLEELRRETGMALILISHDLAVVGDICDRIAVMQGGNLVEQGASAEVLKSPQHPYTRGLLACHPGLHPPGSRLTTLEEVPDEQA